MPVSGRTVRYAFWTICRLGLLAQLLAVASCSKSAQDYAASGNRYFEQKQYDRAIVEYQNAIKVNPQLGEVRAKLADAYRETNDLPKAVGEYIRAADLLPGNIPLQLVAIRAFLTSARFEDAKARAEQVLKQDPRNAVAQGLLGSALVGLHDMEGALKEVEEAIRLDPTGAPIQIKLGALNVSRGNVVAAEAAFRRAADLDPKSLDPQMTLANLYWWMGRFKDAEHAFHQALTISPSDAVANRATALFYVSTRRPQLAEPYLQALAKSSTDPGNRILLADYYVAQNQRARAIEIFAGLTKDPTAQSRLASLQYLDGKTTEAHRIIDAVLLREPNHAEALLVKADFLLKEKKPEEALTRARAAAAAHPQLASAHYALGLTYRATNKLDEAIQSFDEAIRLNPRAVAAEVALAQTHLLLDSASKSIQYARDALKSNPRSAQARLTLVTSLISQGQAKDAEAELKPLAAQYPRSAVVQAYMGAASLLSNNQTSARQSFERALQLDPNSPEALAGLVSLDVSSKRIAEARARIETRLPSTNPAVLVLAAQVYASAGEPAKAEGLLLKAIEVDSANMRAYEMLGRYYIAQKKLDAARTQFETLAERRPKNVSAHTMVALLLAAQNRNAEARARFERILEIDPRAAVAANNLAWIYADGDGNLDRALDLAQTAKSVLPDEPAVNDTLAWVYYKKNLAPSAIPLLRASVERDPHEPLYHYHLGLAYAKSGDKTRARQSLEQALRLAPDFAGSADAKRVLATL